MDRNKNINFCMYRYVPVKSGSFGSSGSFSYVFPGRYVFRQNFKMAVLTKKWQFWPLKLPVGFFKVAVFGSETSKNASENP